ncbi:MAG: DUF4432 family protein, partial [Alphaproteobacteria bacterium]
MSETKLELSRSWHWGQEQHLASHGAINVATFRYPGGTHALRISTDVGEIVMLPFQGQQIWDATFLGRSLTMKTMFDQPLPTLDYMRTYGAFLIHCGATAMGPPGEGDDHPPHGELPNAVFDSAHLRFGEDDGGRYVVVGGAYRHTVAFQANYVFRPQVRITEGSTALQVSLEVENLMHSPMELMYLAHANFRPLDGSQILDNASALRLRTELPSHVTPSADFAQTMERLTQTPDAHRMIDDAAVYDPEVVLFLDFNEAEAINLARHPDGTGDFIRYPTASLPRCSRWISRTADQDCIGLALPGTAEPEGKTRERAKGNIMVLGARETYACSYDLGALDAAGAERLAQKLS